MNPEWKPAEPPYSDPVRDVLDDLEFSIDLGGGLGPQPDWQMDGLGNILNALEASIEGTTVPPLTFGPPELAVAPVPPPERIPVNPKSGAEPPYPQQFPERRWCDLEPPLAATPYYLHQGLKTPSYHSIRGSGTGIRNTVGQELARWCAEANEPVRQEDCQGCEQWGDHGDGFERCRHDWLAENNGTDGDKEQDRA